jgi:hypothetical protein
MYFASKPETSVERWTKLLTLVSLAVSMPVAVWHYAAERGKEAERFSEKTYDDLDQRYIDFERLCMQHAKLDCYDAPMSNPPPLTDEEKLQQKMLYNIVLSISERAFVAYQKTPKLAAKEWKGWDTFLRNYLRRQSFLDLWKNEGGEYNSDFQDYVNKAIKNIAVVAPTLKPVDGTP